MKKLKEILFLNNNDKQIFFKNTFWLFVGEFGVRILKLLLFVYAARKIGVHEWGIFSYALAIMSTVAIISDIGINSVLIKKVAGKEENNIYISTGFILKIILSMISGTIMILIMFFMKDSNLAKNLIPIMSIVLIIDSLREFGFTLNRIFEKMEIESITKIFTTLILVICAIIFINNNNTAISISYSYLISGLLGLFISYILFKKYIKNLFGNFNKKLLLPIFQEAWPLAIFSIFGIIMINIDTIILGYYKNPFSVGIYSVAQKPIQLLYLIPSLMGTALLPMFSRLILTDKEKMKIIVNKILNFLLFLIIPLTVASILLGKEIILLLFGIEYINSVNIFRIMTISIPFMSIGMILSNIIFIQGNQKIIAKSIIISTIINIILCIILIPKFDTYGAAISTTLSQIINNLLIIKSNKLTEIKIKLIKIVLSTILMSIIILLIKNYFNIFLTILLSIITYISISIILKEKNIRILFLLDR